MFTYDTWLKGQPTTEPDFHGFCFNYLRTELPAKTYCPTSHRQVIDRNRSLSYLIIAAQLPETRQVRETDLARQAGVVMGPPSDIFSTQTKDIKVITQPWHYIPNYLVTYQVTRPNGELCSISPSRWSQLVRTSQRAVKSPLLASKCDQAENNILSSSNVSDCESHGSRPVRVSFERRCLLLWIRVCIA
jgi:hypothetical protein